MEIKTKVYVYNLFFFTKIINKNIKTLRKAKSIRLLKINMIIITNS